MFGYDTIGVAGSTLCTSRPTEASDEAENIPTFHHGGFPRRPSRGCRKAHDAAAGTGRQTGRSAWTHESFAEFPENCRTGQSALSRQGDLLELSWERRRWSWAVGGSAGSIAT